MTYHKTNAICFYLSTLYTWTSPFLVFIRACLDCPRHIVAKLVYLKYVTIMNHYFGMCIAYVEESSYFDQVYAKDVLWNNYGTHKQIPKFWIRCFRGGVPSYVSVLSEIYDEPARQSILALAYKTAATDPKVDKDKYKMSGSRNLLQTEWKVEQELFNRVNEVGQKIKQVRRQRHFFWPGVYTWKVRVEFVMCYDCLEISPNHCSAQCKHNTKEKRHPAAYVTKSGNVAGLDFCLFAEAAATVQHAESEMIEAELRSITGLEMVHEYKRLLLLQHSKLCEPAQMPRLGRRSDESKVIKVWMQDYPEERCDMPQPTLEKQEARFEFGEIVENVEHLKDFYESKAEKMLPVTLVLPAISTMADHRLKADGLDVGQNFIMPDGQLQRRKCPIVAVCEDKTIPLSDTFAKVQEEAVLFSEASSDIHHKYAHLNHVTKLDEH
jgi:hypothetical protein